MRLRTACLVTSLAVLTCAPLLGRAADPAGAPWSVRMADSIMARQPKARMIENPTDKSPGWSYSTALAVYGVAKVGEKTGEEKYVQYARDYADEFVDANGVIDPKKYKPETYKLDDLAPGRLLMLLSRHPGGEKYKKAVQELLEQVKTQPRNSDGGFWHKKVYPHQMWLDGIFMACPLLAESGATFHRPELIDDACAQIQLIAAHTRDEKTGLFFHGYDDSREQKWADQTTGRSPNLWGRADGWYAAGIVDTLDNVPTEDPNRAKVIAILQGLAGGIAKAQDPESHCWWQVLDQPKREGNYLESSASCMFVYALTKGVRNHYIDESYLDVAKSGYAGILKQFVEVDDKGLVTLKDTCLVAGLGGKPYRDGSYEYYIHEKRGSNDPKGMGPFILASLELEQLSSK
ncbi:MAG: glycoside hydrolase family 88/105 protein [Phycisphaerae bacterium]